MTALTPSHLWKTMTPEQRVRVARAFWLDKETASDQMQAILLIAKQKKFRPKSVAALDVERKARYLANLRTLPDTIVARALIVHHLAHERPMMSTFLDALAIPHENGLIQDDQGVPDPSKIGPAVQQISDQFPAESVSLYLKTLLCQDPRTWSALEELPQVAAPSAGE
jgi:hypothetical protein